jgi:hypothetical protein
MTQVDIIKSAGEIPEVEPTRSRRKELVAGKMTDAS